MPLAIYLKNFAATLATQALTHKGGPAAEEHAGRLGSISNLLLQACLAPNVAQKYKNQLPIIITRLLLAIQTLTKNEEAHFNNYLENVIKQIVAGLLEVQNNETLIGAILLCEVVFTVLKPSNFLQAFEPLMVALQGVC